MDEDLIPTANDNTEKYVSYLQLLKKYDEARAGEFYFECLWILYAMLEDRTSLFLYHLGFTSNKNCSYVTRSKKIKPQIRSILNMTGSKEKYRFNTFSGKLDRIQQVLLWCISERAADTPYKEELIKVLLPIAQQGKIGDSLLYLNNDWRCKRNQLTHALFSKKIDANELQLLVNNGYEIVKTFDEAVSKIKEQNIREKFKIR